MIKILITDPLSDKGIEKLKDAGFDVIYKPNLSTDELFSLVGEIDGWIIRSGTKVTKDLIHLYFGLIKGSITCFGDT